MIWLYQWHYPKTEEDILKLLEVWEYVSWHNIYHAVLLKRWHDNDNKSQGGVI